MKGSISLTISFLLSLCSFGQNVSYNWANSTSGSTAGAIFNYGTQSNERIETDEQGNVIVLGSFGSNVDLDPGVSNLTTSSDGSDDMFLKKFNNNGDLIWVKTFKVDSSFICGGLAIDEYGSIFISGIFVDKIDADPGIGSYILLANPSYGVSASSFIIKLDQFGNFIWGDVMIDSRIHDLDVDNNANVFAVGERKIASTVTAISNISIYKYDNSGNLIWLEELANNNFNQEFGFSIDNDNDLVLTGQFSSTLDFDPGLGNEIYTATDQTDTNSDLFIVKLSNDGVFIWVEIIPIIAGQGIYGNALTTDSDNNILLTGNYWGGIDFDPGPAVDIQPATNANCYVLKLNTNGDYIWSRSIGGLYSDNGVDIVADELNSLYFTGIFSDTTDFDPGPGSSIFNPSYGNYNEKIFIEKLNPNGELEWYVPYETSGSIYNTSLAIDLSGNIVTVGNFTGNIDFDPGSGVVMYNNLNCGAGAFMIELSQPESILTMNEISFTRKIYPNPTSSEFYIDLDEFNPVDISLYDLNGRLILHKEHCHGIQRFEIDGESGVYILEMKIDNHFETVRIVKQ